MSEMVDAILGWQDRCQRGIDAGAEEGDIAMLRLRDSGVSADIRRGHQWVSANRATLEACLR